jgi:hypothetical protein
MAQKEPMPNDHSRLQCVPSVLVLLVHNPVTDCFRFVEVGSEIILRFLHFRRGLCPYLSVRMRITATHNTSFIFKNLNIM